MTFLWVAVPLVAILSMLLLTSTFIEHDPEQAAAKRIIDWAMTYIVLVLLLVIVVQLAHTWRAQDWWLAGRTLVMPIWITASWLPLMMMLATWSSYQSMFNVARLTSPGRLSLRARAGAVLAIGIRPSRVAVLSGAHYRAFGARATGFVSGWRVARGLVRQARIPDAPSALQVRVEAYLADSGLEPLEDLDRERAMSFGSDDPLTRARRVFYEITDMDAMALQDLIRAAQNDDARGQEGLPGCDHG